MSTDWKPETRDGQLAMAKNWSAVLSAQGSDWNVPATETQELTALTSAADATLADAKNEAIRTPASTARCREAFSNLTDKMRDIKKRYFCMPPLAEADIVSLGLNPAGIAHTSIGAPTAREAFSNLTGKMRDIKKRYFCMPPLAETDIVSLGFNPADTASTPTGAPTAQVTIETYLVGAHELGVKIIYVAGNPNDPANKGFRIWYAVAPPAGQAPASPEELSESFYTQRKKDLIKFDCEESGKTVYFAVKIENGSRKGPWGPLSSALIP